MSQSPAPQEERIPDSAAAPVPAAPHPRRARKKQAPVFIYLIILFFAAFFLLALSYFMQQRTMAESLAGLKDSVSSMEKAQLLQEENLTLKTRQTELTQEVEALTEELARLSGELETAQAAVDSQSRTAEAMDWFWQIDEAYVRGRYKLARNLIQTMDETLVAFLPQESATDTDRFSPAQRYQEIYDALY